MNHSNKDQIIQLLKIIAGQQLAFAFIKVRAAGFRLRVFSFDGVDSGSQINFNDHDVLTTVSAGTVTTAWFAVPRDTDRVKDKQRNKHASNNRATSGTNQTNRPTDHLRGIPRRGHSIAQEATRRAPSPVVAGQPGLD